MALIPCPDCKKEISDQAVACIGCGRPVDADMRKLAAVQALGYRLCPCTYPPQVMLWNSTKRTEYCPHCHAEHLPYDPDAIGRLNPIPDKR